MIVKLSHVYKLRSLLIIKLQNKNLGNPGLEIIEESLRAHYPLRLD